MKKTTQSTKSENRRKWTSPNPTCPIIVSRVPLYAPVLKTVYNSPRKTAIYRSETPWGIIESEGKLITQEHRAILDMATKLSKKKKKYNNGSMGVFFDIYRLRKILKYEGGRGLKLFIQKLEDMRKNKLTIQDKTKQKVSVSGIIDYYDYENRIDDKEGIELANARQGNCIFEIRLSPNYMKIYQMGIRAHYDELIDDIIKIQDGTIRAMIHFFLTHQKTCRYTIKQVLEDIGAITNEISKRQIEKLMKKPIEYKAELEKFGIIVEDKTLYYKRNQKVFFSHPPKISEPKYHEIGT